MKRSAFKIEIPEPCGEDWNRMLPEGEGRYCDSCSKTVVDFTGKSDEEIAAFLSGNKGRHLCGHFHASQVNRPILIPVDLYQLPRMSITHRFAFAVMIVFGTLLFSCRDHNGKAIRDIQFSEQADFYTTGVVLAPEIVSDVITGDTIAMVSEKTPYDELLVTQKAEKQAQNIQTAELTACVTAEFITVTGKMKGEVVVVEAPIPIDSPFTKVKVVGQDFIAGGMSIVEVYQDGSTGSDTPETDVMEDPDRARLNDDPAEVSLFPNPGTQDFTVAYNLRKPSDVRIDVFDLPGNFIRNLVAMRSQHNGLYQVPFSLQVPNGLYIVNVIVNGELRSKKLIVEQGR